jgi:hypothetical protein
LAREPGAFSTFFPETGARFDVCPQKGLQILSRLAEAVIAPGASDLALLDDPAAAVRLAADHLARQHSLDPARTRACLERLLAACGPTPPCGLQLIPAFAHGVLSMVWVVAESQLFEEPLAFCEGEVDPRAFPRRQFAAEVLADPTTPLYALSELARRLAEFTAHQEANREGLLGRGHPTTTFASSPFLDLWLNKLYYVKAPVHTGIFGATPRAAYDDRYTARRRLAAPATAHKFWRPAAEWAEAARTNQTSPCPARLYTWGRWEDIQASACAYDQADPVTRLTEDDVEWLPTVRPAVLDFKLRALGVLRLAAESGTAEGLWERCLEALNATLGGVEAVKRLLRTDARYAGYNALSGLQEQDEVSCVPGGLTNVLEVIGHVEKELTVGTYRKTRAALGDLVVLDRLDRPSLVCAGGKDPYLALAAKGPLDRVRAALDLWAELDTRETGLWEDFRQRLARALEADMRTSAVVPVPAKYQALVQPVLEHEAAALIRRLEAGDRSLAGRPRAPKRPTAKFSRFEGLRWEEVTMTFLPGDRLSIRARGHQRVFSFKELGFRDNRKGERPDTRWAFLLRLAALGGVLRWDSAADRQTKARAKAAVKDIRHRLKAVMGIDSDPFKSYRQVKGYEARYVLIGPSSEQEDSHDATPDD